MAGYVYCRTRDTKEEKPTYILIDRMREDGQGLLIVNEPYAQVKQKIMDAERTYYPTVVEDYAFTREEYELIKDALLIKLNKLAKDNPCDMEYYNCDRIVDKLNEILKEEDE